MPQTGQTEPDSIPTKNMQSLKNKNNIADIFMKKQMEIFEKERDLNLSNIDQDRLDIRDFLKKLKKCASDDLPEAKHWLGDRTPRRSSQILVYGPRKRVKNIPVDSNENKDENGKEEIKQESEKEDYEKYNFTFRTQDDKPEMVQRATRLYNLFSKRAEYAGMDQQVWGDCKKKDSNDDNTQFENKAVDKRRRTLASRSTSASTEGKGEGRRVMGELLHRSLPREAFTAHATQLHVHQRPPIISGTQPNRSALPHLGQTTTEGEAFMEEILDRKFRRNKRNKLPLEDRLQSFYDKVAHMKVEEMAMAADLADWENDRRWKVLTKGVKAALADSSDDEEPNLDHTL